MNGEVINNLRYADDTVLLDFIQEDLQIILDSVIENCKGASLALNIQKTKLLIIRKQQNIKTSVYVNGILFEQIDQIKYKFFFII